MIDLSELRDIPFLEELATDELQTIANESELISLGEEEILFREDESGRDLFLVLEGELLIEIQPAGQELEEALEIHQAKPGEVIGEISYIDHSSRSATVRGTRKARLIQIPASSLDRLMNEDSSLGYRLMKKIAGSLAERLRDTDLRYRNSMGWI